VVRLWYTPGRPEHRAAHTAQRPCTHAEPAPAAGGGAGAAAPGWARAQARRPATAAPPPAWTSHAAAPWAAWIAPRPPARAAAPAHAAAPAAHCSTDEGQVGFRFPAAPVEDSRASPPHRPREDRLTHPADTSRSNIAEALGLLSRWRLSKSLNFERSHHVPTIPSLFSFSLSLSLFRTCTWSMMVRGALNIWMTRPSGSV
jgi:hypothetical protein